MMTTLSNRWDIYVSVKLFENELVFLRNKNGQILKRNPFQSEHLFVRIATLS